MAKLTNLLENQNEQLEEDSLCDALTQERQTSKARCPFLLRHHWGYSALWIF